MGGRRDDARSNWVTPDCELVQVIVGFVMKEVKGFEAFPKFQHIAVLGRKE